MRAKERESCMSDRREGWRYAVLVCEEKGGEWRVEIWSWD